VKWGVCLRGLCGYSLWVAPREEVHWRLRREACPAEGRRNRIQGGRRFISFLAKWGRLGLWKRWVCRVRVFFLYFSNVLKLPSPCVCLKTSIYRQNVAWASKLVPQLLFFFVNFDFFYFFVFF